MFNITGESVTVNRYIEVLADVVGEAPDVVHVPDSMLADLPGAVFGHLFGVRHHAMMSIEKAQRLLGFTNRFDLRSGHADTYEWFRRKGYADVEGPMVDPMWRASWDFDDRGCGRANGCAVGEPSDAEMWRSVEATVRNVLLPSITDDWARVITVQLAGMARYAATRPPDPTAARVAELAAALDRLAGNPVVAAHWPVAIRRAAGCARRGQRGAR